MTDERDLYEVLGVSPGASDAEIREAYRARARRLHPDLVGESGLDEMRLLNQAWTVLKDTERRGDYDRSHGHAPRGEGAAGSGGSTPASAKSGGSRDFGSQPAWTGAAGAPPGRPWGPVLGFGIYAGWSIGEIARRDRGYLTWLRDKPEAKPFRAEIDKLLEADAASQAAADSRKDRNRR